MNWLNGILKSFDKLPVSWVDFLTLIIVCVGFARGRKRGLSEELLDTVQWLIIIVAGAFLYHTLGDLLYQKPLLSLLSYYLLSYILIAVGIKLVFVFVKRRLGQKLVESDMFGRFEFYGGMAAGSVRWLCMYFFVLSMLHAPLYTAEELEARRRYVDYNFGSDFFPSIDKIQAEVFKVSFTGQGATKFLGRFLIEPTSSQAKALRGETSLARRNERRIDAVLGVK